MAQQAKVCSPDQQLQVNVYCDEGRAEYEVVYQGVTVLERSQLGFCTNIGDFAGNLRLTDCHEQPVSKHYRMDRVKASDISYEANRLDVEFENADKLCMTVTFCVSERKTDWIPSAVMNPPVWEESPQYSVMARFETG